jgi:hypothetical protein
MQHRVCPLLTRLMRRAESNHDEERAVELLWVVCGFTGPNLAHAVNQ